MGGDGGSIPSRIDQVKTKKKLEKIDREFEVAMRWRNCALSQDRLHTPIVACRLGRLYNKESVLEALIDKSTGEHFATSHMRSLRDVKELALTPNRAFRPEKLEVGTSGDTNIDTQIGQWVCPVLGVEMNGFHRFCVIWPCGCVCSEKALKELKTTACFKCGAPFSPADVLVLNGDEEEVAGYRRRVEAEAAGRKRAKKNKGAKAAAATTAATSSGGAAADAGGKKRPAPAVADSAGNSSDKKSKADSIQDDPTVSAAVKSMFTTSTGGRAQAERISGQFWVTHDPTHY